jgi:hypothetical protein
MKDVGIWPVKYNVTNRFVAIIHISNPGRVDKTLSRQSRGVSALPPIHVVRTALITTHFKPFYEV